MEENIRLKTKISILEKEKDKMNRYMDSASEGISKQTNSRLNIYGVKGTDVYLVISIERKHDRQKLEKNC